MKNLLKVKPLIEKHQLKNGKGRGKLTILFSPELMAAIEANMLNTVPGTNVNSNRTVGETAKRAGVEATRTRLRENYKRDKRHNVGEMHTYVASKERQDPITGEPVITETTDVGPNGSGAMSGRDPLLGTMFDLYTGAKAWNSGTKLLLWGAGKYMPSTMLGLWGRTGIINDVARRSFNPGGWGQLTVKPQVRTKVGDVEIDNPGLYYHQSDAGKAKNFVSTGRMRTPLEESWLAKEEAGEKIPLTIRSGIKPGYPQDPGSAMFSQGKLWYGLTTNKPDLLVTAREMPVANKNASIMSNKASLRALEEQGARRVTNDNIYTQGPHNRQNTTAYVWEPGYGYRRVFAEESPTLNWTDGIGLTRYEPYKRKQGGKMFRFKKGNKIHIKKANRGKFTDYCGGEVTNECILRGKHSSNPAVRKRATFALNARRWKHKLGGVIKADDGTKFTINDGLALGSQLVGNIANSIQ